MFSAKLMKRKQLATTFHYLGTAPSQHRDGFLITVIAEIFVRVKISYSSVREFSYAINFRTLKPVSRTLVYVQGFRMLLIFVLSAKSTKYTKLNRVLKFLRLQYIITVRVANFVAYTLDDHSSTHRCILHKHCKCKSLCA